MEVRAHLRHLRIAPRKVRLVIDLIRGQRVAQAVDQLTMLPKRAAKPILKLVQSAVANAEHNFHLDRKTLVIKAITANEGPRLHRYRPRAFGRAAELVKRSSHITVILDGQPAATKKTVETKPAAETPLPTKPKSIGSAKKLSTAPAAAPAPDGSQQAKTRSGRDRLIRRQGLE